MHYNFKDKQTQWAIPTECQNSETKIASNGTEKPQQRLANNGKLTTNRTSVLFLLN